MTTELDSLCFTFLCCRTVGIRCSCIRERCFVFAYFKHGCINNLEIPYSICTLFITDFCLKTAVRAIAQRYLPNLLKWWCHHIIIPWTVHFPLEWQPSKVLIISYNGLITCHLARVMKTLTQGLLITLTYRSPEDDLRGAKWVSRAGSLKETADWLK